MKYIEKPLSLTEVTGFNREYDNYVKITADVDRGSLVVGCLLHVDGEEILLKNGSKQESIWGGGLNFASKEARPSRFWAGCLMRLFLLKLLPLLKKSDLFN